MYRVKIKPSELPGPPFYSRLFAPTDKPISADDQRLKDLAWSMCDKNTGGDDPFISPAYTYFGQFIDHDLTDEDRTTNPITNGRLRFLNLDSVYGEHPSVGGDLYESDGSFRLGKPAFDVPLSNCNGKPVAADMRNVENSIVRQLHVLFLKLHNVAVRALPKIWSPARRLAKARQRVCHQYQYLIRTDFLPRVCHPDIYGSILHEPMIDWDDQFSIPIEFSQAAFRFGHSMVRSAYVLQKGGHSVPLETLFSDEEREKPLLPERAIDWPHFLDPYASSSDLAMRINTSIVPPLFQVPASAGELFRIKTVDPIVLPHRTLQRGAASCLSSGQAAQKTLRACPISTADPTPWADLIKCNLHEETPLWYYILLEAELNEYSGLLGPVGGRIVGEVIEGALLANDKSYVRMFCSCWKPDPWPVGNGKMQIETLLDLVTVINSQSE